MSVKLVWEPVDDDSSIASTERAKVHGGWLVKRTLDVMVSLHEDMPLLKVMNGERLCVLFQILIIIGNKI